MLADGLFSAVLHASNTRPCSGYRAFPEVITVAALPPDTEDCPHSSADPAPAQRLADLREAMKDSTSVGLALFPLGVTFGVLVTQAGLAWWWASVFTALIYAGSLDFLLIGLVMTAAPLAQITLTALVVNFRHVFYALSFPLHQVKSRIGKVYSTFALTDETYAATTGKDVRSWSGGRIVWLQILFQLYWVAGGTAGAAFGSLVPARLDGMDFAMTALFVVLAIEAYKAQREIPTPVLALVCALVSALLVPDQMLLAALVLFTSCLLAHRLVARKKRARA